MDSELRAILESMQASLQSMDDRLHGVEKRLDGVDARFDAVDSRFDAMERLIVNVKESLECEVGEVKTRLDPQDARLERQGGYLQTGSRWMARTVEWTEKVDARLAANQQEIADIKDRLSRLEKKSA